MNDLRPPAPGYPALAEDLLGRAQRAREHWRTPGAERLAMTPDAPIDWTSPAITDRTHVRHRTNAGPGGSRVSCTYLDDTLLGCGLHDPARYASGRLGMTDALGPTIGNPRYRNVGNPWCFLLNRRSMGRPFNESQGVGGRPCSRPPNRLGLLGVLRSAATNCTARSPPTSGDVPRRPDQSAPTPQPVSL